VYDNDTGANQSDDIRNGHNKINDKNKYCFNNNLELDLGIKNINEKNKYLSELLLEFLESDKNLNNESYNKISN
jgi:hypothetical protein